MESTLLASELRKVSCSERLAFVDFWLLTIFWRYFGLRQILDRYINFATTITPNNLIVISPERSLSRYLGKSS